MQDRLKFRAIVKGYYYNDTPEKYEEFEPKIFLENVDILSNGQIGICGEDLEIAIRKQYPNLQNADIDYMLEYFRDDSTGFETYVTITPEIVQQSTGLKDKNGKLIYEGDILYIKSCGMKCVIEWHKPSYRLMVHVFGPDDIVDFDEILNEKGECPFEVIGNIYENEDLLNAT